MNSTDKISRGQALAFNRILSVRRFPFHDGFKFRVELRSDRGTVETVDVTASQVGSYQRFQTAVLRQHSILFRDEEYEVRLGKVAWRDDLWALLRAAETEEPAVTV